MLAEGVRRVSSLIFCCYKRVPETGKFVNKRGLFGLLVLESGKSKNMAAAFAWLLVKTLYDFNSWWKWKGKPCVQGRDDTRGCLILEQLAL